MRRVIKVCGDLRITEVVDNDISLADLKGDSYDANVNSDIDPVELGRQEKDFERRVTDEGVFYYILEQWNPSIGIGWVFVDSIGGFIGTDFIGSGSDVEMCSRCKTNL